MNWVYWLSGDRRAAGFSSIWSSRCSSRSLSNEHLGLAAARRCTSSSCCCWRSRSARTWPPSTKARATRAQRIGGWLERLIYRGAGVDPARDMSWIDYALAMLWFNLLGALVVYALQRLQQWLPLNPQDMAAVSPDSSFNTATSFVTNTNWQGYGGESTMSYLTQMLGLGVQNFVSAATGMAVLVALIRGFARKQAQGHRQLLGRSRRARRSTSCCRCRSCSRSCW